MKVLGIDYSISSPGVCLYSEEKAKWWVQYALKTKTPFPTPSVDINFIPTETTGIGHFCDLADWVHMILHKHPVDLIVIEDYAFGANGRMTQLAENCGILKAQLFRKWQFIPLKLVAPGTLKKFATGSGHAKKEQMWEAFCKDFPEAAGWPKLLWPKSKGTKILSPLSDIADAYFLARLGHGTLEKETSK